MAQLNELYMSMALQWHCEQQVNIEYIVNELKENESKWSMIQTR